MNQMTRLCSKSFSPFKYTHLSNKRGGGAKVAKSINVELGINVEGGIFFSKSVILER